MGSPEDSHAALTAFVAATTLDLTGLKALTNSHEDKCSCFQWIHDTRELKEMPFHRFDARAVSWRALSTRDAVNAVRAKLQVEDTAPLCFVVHDGVHVHVVHGSGMTVMMKDKKTWSPPTYAYLTEGVGAKHFAEYALPLLEGGSSLSDTFKESVKYGALFCTLLLAEGYRWRSSVLVTVDLLTKDPGNLFAWHPMILARPNGEAVETAHDVDKKLAQDLFDWVLYSSDGSRQTRVIEVAEKREQRMFTFLKKRIGTGVSAADLGLTKPESDPPALERDFFLYCKGMKPALQSFVVKNSVSGTCSVAIKEWELKRLEIRKKMDGTCPCGKSHLKYLFHIRNRTTHCNATVGSTCMRTFANTPPALLDSDILKEARRQGIIDDQQLNVYEKFRRCKKELSQKNRVNIHGYIAKGFSERVQCENSVKRGKGKEAEPCANLAMGGKTKTVSVQGGTKKDQYFSLCVECRGKAKAKQVKAK
jgi:hypothetical protein